MELQTAMAMFADDTLFAIRVRDEKRWFFGKGASFQEKCLNKLNYYNVAGKPRCKGNAIVIEMQLFTKAYKLKDAFGSPYEQYESRNGQAFVLLGETDRAIVDFDETGPLFDIRFADGEIIQAWPEDIYVLEEGA